VLFASAMTAVSTATARLPMAAPTPVAAALAFAVLPKTPITVATVATTLPASWLARLPVAAASAATR
jgi:hypothetical protein